MSWLIAANDSSRRFAGSPPQDAKSQPDRQQALAVCDPPRLVHPACEDGLAQIHVELFGILQFGKNHRCREICTNFYICLLRCRFHWIVGIARLS